MTDTGIRTPHPFDGKGEVSAWINSMTRFSLAMKWTAEEEVLRVPTYLEGQALMAIAHLKSEVTAEKIFDVLRQQFGVSSAAARQQLTHREQGPSESVGTYTAALRELASRAEDVKTPELTSFWLRGLLPAIKPFLAQPAAAQKEPDLGDLLAIAMGLELAQATSSSRQDRRRTLHPQRSHQRIDGYCTTRLGVKRRSSTAMNKGKISVDQIPAPELL